MKKTRITLDDRINIQAALEKHQLIDEVCRLIKKNRSSVYRELKKYSIEKESVHRSCFHCSKIKQCRNEGIIEGGKIKYKCTNYVPIQCPHLKHFPYVCNGCLFIEQCLQNKRYYNCSKAEIMSRKNRVTTRKRKRISNDDIIFIDKLVAPLVIKGQSLHHIYETNKELHNICSERTIRRLIYDHYLSVSASSLPRYVRFKHSSGYHSIRKNKMAQIERMLERTYTDFLKYCKNHPDASVVQYDSVIGKLTDKKAILTITFPKERFQFGRLIVKENPQSVLSTMNYLFAHFDLEEAKKIFAINLADNGIEFSKFHQLEMKGVRVYYTNPYRSTDKASCERNHEFIRYIIRKGRSLDDLTQEKLNLLFSHINSYVRKSNNNKTPFELIEERFGSEFLSIIGIKKIEPRDVYLRPALLN